MSHTNSICLGLASTRKSHPTRSLKPGRLNHLAIMQALANDRFRHVLPTVNAVFSFGPEYLHLLSAAMIPKLPLQNLHFRYRCFITKAAFNGLLVSCNHLWLLALFSGIVCASERLISTRSQPIIPEQALKQENLLHSSFMSGEHK
jgi:hypothetical protein